LEAEPVSLTVSLRDEHVRERRADHLLARPPEGLLGGSVPGRDLAGAVHRDERLLRGVQDLPETVLALDELLLGLLALRDIGGDHAHAIRTTTLVEQRELDREVGVRTVLARRRLLELERAALLEHPPI